MMKKYFVLLSLFWLLGLTTNAQQIRLSMQAGAAIPVGEFAMNTATPDSGGFAGTGFNIGFVAERVFPNHWVVGINLGYSVFGMDTDAIKKQIWPSNPDNVYVETQSFQNINLQGRLGYQWEPVEEKFGMVPFIDLGVGVFNSAFYAIKDGRGNFIVRAGNTGTGFLLSPGVDTWFAINNYMNIKVYGTYQFTSYKVDETFTLNQQFLKTNTITYQYGSIGVGAGVSFVF